MTTRTILSATRDHVNDAGLLAPYEDLYFRWSDSDVGGNTPFILFRFPGSNGPSSILLQQRDVLIVLVDTKGESERGHDRISAIERLFRQGGIQPGIRRFEVLGGLNGPLYLENDRPVWQLNIRCYTEDF